MNWDDGQGCGGYDQRQGIYVYERPCWERGLDDVFSVGNGQTDARDSASVPSIYLSTCEWAMPNGE